MSIDDQIDNFLRVCSPTMIGLWFIFFYNRATNATAPLIAQVQKTIEAIRKSFTSDAIYCFYDSVHVPVPYGSTIGGGTVALEAAAESPRWYTWNNYWYEKPEDFAENPEGVRRLSWLSADIICDGHMIADITDFISGLTYKGTLPPTPEYILALWCYRNHMLLKRAHTQLVVIDNEAETHSFNFAPTAANDSSWLRSLGLSNNGSAFFIGDQAH